MKTSVKVAASCGAVIAIVGAVLLMSSEQTAPGSPSRLDVRAAFKGLSAQAPSPCTFVPGRGAAWNYQFKTTMTGQAGQSGERHVVARLQVEPLRVVSDVGEAVVLARLAGVDDATRQTLGKELEDAFLLTVSERCEIKRFARGKNVPLTTARAQQAAMHQLWFRVPRAETEKAGGEDGVGQFEAELVTGEVDGRQLAQRRITAYARGWAPGALPVVEESFLSAKLGTTPWFDSIEGVERLAGLPVGSSRGELSLTGLPFDPVAFAGVSRNEADYVWENLLPRAGVAPVAPVAERPRFSEAELREHAALKNVSYETALDRFAARIETSPYVHEQWPAMARYLEAHPEVIESYSQSLSEEDFPSNVRGTAFLALGKARVPEARNALMGIRRDERVLPLDRHRANLALVEREDVGIELAQALRGESTRIYSRNEAERFYARQSALALGMMVGVRQRGVEVQDEATGMIRQLLKGGQSAADLSPAFGAMGNTGDPSLLPELETFVRSADPEIRAAAAQGFRRLKPEVTEAFVVGWLTRETSPDVKRDLFNVIYHQHLDARINVSEAIARFAAAHLAEQPLVLTRQSLVRLLGPLAGTYPFARAALLAQVKHEVHADSGLYDLISQYVHGDEVSRALRDLPEFQTEPGGPAPVSTRAGLFPINSTSVGSISVDSVVEVSR